MILARLKAASLSILGNFFGIPLQLIAAVLVARSLGPTLYGDFSFAMEYSIIFASMSEAGLGILATREIPRHLERKGEYMGSLLLMKMVFGLCIYLVLIGIAKIWGFTPEVFLAIVFIGLSSILQMSFPLIFGILRAHKVMELEGILFLSQPLLYVIFVSAYYFLASDFSLLAVSLCLLMSFVLSTAVGAFLVLRVSRTRWEINISLVRRMIRDSLFLGASFSLAALYLRIVFFALNSFCTSEEIGHFSIAFRLTFYLISIPNIVCGSFLPDLSVYFIKSKTDYIKTSMHLILVLLSMSVLCIIVIFAMAPYIVSFLFGAEYIPAIAPFRILLFSTLFFWSNLGLRTIFESSDNHTSWTYIMATGAAINGLACLVLIPQWGILGASWAILLAAAFMSALAWWRMFRKIASFSDVKGAFSPDH